jgi:hypothetical protein
MRDVRLTGDEVFLKEPDSAFRIVKDGERHSILDAISKD